MTWCLALLPTYKIVNYFDLSYFEFLSPEINSSYATGHRETSGETYRPRSDARV